MGNNVVHIHERTPKSTPLTQSDGGPTRHRPHHEEEHNKFLVFMGHTRAKLWAVVAALGVLGPVVGYLYVMQATMIAGPHPPSTPTQTASSSEGLATPFHYVEVPPGTTLDALAAAKKVAPRIIIEINHLRPHRTPDGRIYWLKAGQLVRVPS
jgi:hypothetical protein